MKKTAVTYGQLDKILRSLGFSCRLIQEEPPTGVYEHKETGASFMLPQLPVTDGVLDYHLAGARGILDAFGIADTSIFDAELLKAC